MTSHLKGFVTEMISPHLTTEELIRTCSIKVPKSIKKTNEQRKGMLQLNLFLAWISQETEWECERKRKSTLICQVEIVSLAEAEVLIRGLTAQLWLELTSVPSNAVSAVEAPNYFPGTCVYFLLVFFSGISCTNA